MAWRYFRQWGKRLTLNIRSESAYEIGEVLKGFTKRPSGRVTFSFYPRLFRSAEIRQEIPYPGVFSHQTGSVPRLSFNFPHLSVNRGFVP